MSKDEAKDFLERFRIANEILRLLCDTAVEDFDIKGEIIDLIHIKKTSANNIIDRAEDAEAGLPIDEVAFRRDLHRDQELVRKLIEAMKKLSVAK